jgi:Domain of unknown function (DUF4340)
MSRQRFMQLLIVAVVAISIALFLNARRNQSADTTGLPVFPGLAGDLNAVTAVSLQKGSATPSVTLHRNGDIWTVAERADYPADLTKLRKLLISLGDAKVIEEKTSDPQRFAGIGVDEPASGATGVLIIVTTPTEKRSLIVGKSIGGGNFVRRPTETKSYSVEPGISADADPHYWIDAHLLNIASAQIQDLNVKPLGGPGYSLHRPKPVADVKADTGTKPPAADATATKATADAGAPATPPAPAQAPANDTFTLDGVPAGRKPLESAALSASSNTLATLNADDVAPASSIDFSQASQATITLTDGTVVTLSGTVIGDKHWIQVTSSKDAALTAKTAGRAFDVAPYRYDGIFKPLEQLLVPKPSPAAKEPPVIKGPAAAAPTSPASHSPASSAVPQHSPKGVASPTTP